MISLTAPSPSPSLRPLVPTPAVTVIVIDPQHHDAFEWAANIWIPAGLGVLTLVVTVITAVAAVRVARAGNRLVEQGRQDLARKWRVGLAPEFESWFRGRWREVAAPVDEAFSAHLLKQQSHLGQAFESNNDSDALWLLGYLDEMAGQFIDAQAWARDALEEHGAETIRNWAREGSVFPPTRKDDRK